MTFLASPKSIAINGDAVAAGGGIPGSIYYWGYRSQLMQHQIQFDLAEMKIVRADPLMQLG